MAIIITDECINCDACIWECPNNAIYEPDTKWWYKDRTSLKGMVKTPKGAEVDADAENDAISDEFFYIGFRQMYGVQRLPDEEPQCASVCPVDCCVPDGNHKETEEELLQKKLGCIAKIN